MFSLHAQWWLVSVQWENIRIDVALASDCFFFLFSLTLPLQISIWTSLSAALYVQWCHCPSFQTITLARAWSSVEGTHYVLFCLDRAHMGLLCFTIVSCICFFFNKHCYSAFPSLSLHVCPRVHVGMLLISVMWWPHRPSVMWFLHALSDFFGPIGAWNRR